MAFDPSIILAGMQKPTDPLDTVRTLQDLMQSRQQHQTTLASLMEKQNQERALRDIYARNANNPQGLSQALMAGGFGPQGLAVEEQRAEIESRQAAAEKHRGELRKMGLDMLRNRAAAVKTPEQYSSFIATVPPQMRAELGLTDEYDQGGLASFIAGGIDAQKRTEIEAAANNAKAQREYDAEQRGLDRTNRTTNASILAGQKATEGEKSDVTRLRQEIKSDKAVVKYRNAAAELQSLKELAKDSTGANDMALVFAFMKAMDPESVVREAEYNAAAATGTPDQRMMGLVSKWWTGGPLSQGQRQAFIKAAEAAQSGHKSAFERATKMYTHVAKKHGYDFAELGLDDSGEGAGPSKPPIRQGGHLFEWNPATGQYE